MSDVQIEMKVRFLKIYKAPFPSQTHSDIYIYIYIYREREREICVANPSVSELPVDVEDVEEGEWHSERAQQDARDGHVHDEDIAGRVENLDRQIVR